MTKKSQFFISFLYKECTGIKLYYPLIVILSVSIACYQLLQRIHHEDQINTKAWSKPETDFKVLGATSLMGNLLARGLQASPAGLQNSHQDTPFTGPVSQPMCFCQAAMCPWILIMLFGCLGGRYKGYEWVFQIYKSKFHISLLCSLLCLPLPTLGILLFPCKFCNKKSTILGKEKFLTN